MSPICLAIAIVAASGSASWQEAILDAPYTPARLDKVVLQLIRQDYEALERDRSVIGTPLTIGERKFDRGLGTHSIGQIAIASPDPIERFSAWIGVDHNDRTRGGAGSVVFSIEADGREVFRSKVLRGEEDRPPRGRRGRRSRVRSRGLGGRRDRPAGRGADPVGRDPCRHRPGGRSEISFLVLSCGQAERRHPRPVEA